MRRAMITVGGAMTLVLGGTASAAPAVNEGYDWTMRVNEDRVSDAILAYEVDGTDDQPLNFRCEQGGNRIFAGISGGAPDLTAIELASGSAKLRITGKTEIDEMPFFRSQEIAGGSPLIRAFASNGWLRMTANDRTIDMAATATGKQAIARFVEFCTE